MTKEEVDFLLQLQKEMNTQDSLGNADPRYWVIMSMWRILPLLKWRDESTIFPFLQKYQITLKMISYKRKENTKDESTHNDEPGTGIWHQQTE